LGGFRQKIRKLLQQVRLPNEQGRHRFNHVLNAQNVRLVFVQNVQETGVRGGCTSCFDFGDVGDGVVEIGGRWTTVGAVHLVGNAVVDFSSGKIIFSVQEGAMSCPDEYVRIYGFALPSTGSIGSVALIANLSHHPPPLPSTSPSQ
jgi:hypothetical protein